MNTFGKWYFAVIEITDATMPQEGARRRHQGHRQHYGDQTDKDRTRQNIANVSEIICDYQQSKTRRYEKRFAKQQLRRVHVGEVYGLLRQPGELQCQLAQPRREVK